MRNVSVLDRLLKDLKNALRKRLPDPEPPEDPYSYVGAPKKPRLPRLSATAKAPLE